MNYIPHSNLPIGVFDSGVGGLTVLKALQEKMPCEDFIYLGDTARLPYGTKSRQSIIRYTLQAAAQLVDRQIKLLVIACNTASSAALSILQEQFSPLPVIGVIESGAKACCLHSISGRIAVIGTDSTIKGNAYPQAILHLRKDAQIVSKSCQLFVSLAEEGWYEGIVPEETAKKYLTDIFSVPQPPDCLMLGCTHFPIFKKTLQKVLGNQIILVDSAEETAKYVFSRLEQSKIFGNGSGQCRFLITDDLQRFARIGSIFLGRTIKDTELELIDL